MTAGGSAEGVEAIRFVTSSTGAVTVFNFPEDIYTNTRSGVQHGRDAAELLRAGHRTERVRQAMAKPDGTYRYFAPAGGPGCNFIFTGDCGTQDIHFLGRWFGEMDFRLAKAFQLPGKARFEFSAEIFNATKALNFPNHRSTPGIWREHVPDHVHAEPARTAQLVWRVTW